MAKKKYKLTSPAVQGDKSLVVGDTISLTEDEAAAMHKAGSIELSKEQAMTFKDKELKKQEQGLKEQRELEAFLQKDELEKEKETLLKRIDEIEKILGDGK